MIKNNNQLGLSLAEVLVAIVIFSIVIIGLVNFQSALVTQLTQAKSRNQAQRVAFEILDSYPDSIPVNLPINWQYQVITTLYNTQCKIVKVRIQPDLGEDIMQQRWFCH